MSKTATTNIAGEAYARLAEVKPGDVLIADGDFTCVPAGPVTVKGTRPPQGALYFDCDDGKHMLDGQLNDVGCLVGLTRPPAPIATPAGYEAETGWLIEKPNAARFLTVQASSLSGFVFAADAAAALRFARRQDAEAFIGQWCAPHLKAEAAEHCWLIPGRPSPATPPGEPTLHQVEEFATTDCPDCEHGDNLDGGLPCQTCQGTKRVRL